MNTATGSSSVRPPRAADDVVRLEQAFRRIARERMQGVALLNPALAVEAVGFRQWQGRCLGVLITPWCMNLVLLPGPQDDWSQFATGATQRRAFPSGNYEFIVGRENGLGDYQSCSLFSPVLEFDGSDSARATALAALDALFDARLYESHEAGEIPAGGPGRDAPARSITRRDLLRGAFFHDPAGPGRD